MVNLFINTGFDRAEEDRLTNAWMAVLAHADRSLLAAFLDLAGIQVDATVCGSATFHLQVVLPNSRPDALISLPDLDVAIETKHAAPFDLEQFARHADGLKARRRPARLIALTGDVLSPLDGNQPALPLPIEASHVGWHAIVEMLSNHSKLPDISPVSLLLVEQMRQYLAALGYREREKTSMNDLNDLAQSLRKHAETIRGAQQTLAELAGQLRKIPELADLNWKTGRFKPMDFDYLTAVLPEMPEAALRIYPQLDGHRFCVKYYLTFPAKTGATKPAQERLSSARTELEAKCGPLEACEAEADGYYRVIQRLSDDLTERLYAGDAAGLADAVERIVGLFGAVRAAIR